MKIHQGAEHCRLQNDSQGVVLVRGDVTAGPFKPHQQERRGARCQVITPF